MKLFSRLLSRGSRRGLTSKKLASSEMSVQRHCTFEKLEPRQMLSANPIELGTIYVEEDTGSDSHGDRFEVTFSGGASDTELTRLVINGDQNTPGFSVGDVFFDTEAGGLGADHSAGFTVEELTSSNTHADVQAHVEDGSSQLILEFQNFGPGDRLVFSIDVDEVVDFDSQETDLDTINAGIDPITSGVEFQSSQLVAHFSAPHYQDAEADAIFQNSYDESLAASGLDLPEDDWEGKRDRTAGAFVGVEQDVDPASISGFVYSDDNNDGIRDSGEHGLAGITIEVIPVDTVEPQQTVTVTTDGNGYYEALNLSPGTYRVEQPVQPDGYLDGLDTAGTVDGERRGTAVNPGDKLEDVFLAGGEDGVEYNFGEILPATLSGSVYISDCHGACFGDGTATEPVAGVTVYLLDAADQKVGETITDAYGNYQFVDLEPGTYSVIEVTPPGLIDAGAAAGQVDGTTRGRVVDANTIVDVDLQPDNDAREYDFCEHLPASISGYVYHDRNDNGLREDGEEPISDVTVALFDQEDQQVGVTETDADGFYEFVGLSAGVYRLSESQPEGWFDGDDTPGRVDGEVSGSVSQSDTINEIELLWGSAGVEYNFGELLPGSIQGVVYADMNRNCHFDAGEDPIANVKIELLDANGEVIATTHTNEEGAYEFQGLIPRVHAVRETQPSGYFHGGQSAGSHGGDDSVDDLISGIPVGSDQHLLEYNFCEIAPGSISGIVYVDPNENEVFDTGEEPIRNVTVQLLDADGNVLETARTNAAGEYEFLNLEPGRYAVRELQPEGYFHGGQQAGSNGGDDSVADLISGIQVGPDQQLVHYNFSEITPGSIAGIVYVDPNQNEVFDAGEEPIEDVTVQLLDADGNILETTRTDARGRYEFLDLEPGRYAVRELQPEGYFHGGQQAGSNGGDDSVEDLISGIQVGPDQQLVHYNFSEITPGSIAGTVYVDPNQNEVFDADEEPIEDVTVQLLDADGNILETTRTDARGRYEFLNLEPGPYAVRELQPEEYFHGGQQAGSHGGNDSATDLIAAIAVGAGEQLTRYDFSELPPASISGYVFQDGSPIQTTDGNVPSKLTDVRDGVRRSGDRPIAGVTLELRNGLNGQPILGQQSLDGTDSDRPLTAVTDADGYYEFHGLPAGSYAVYQVHPEQYHDGIDTAGSTGGLPFNISHEPDGPFLQLLNQLRSGLAKDPGDDAIVQIPLGPGQSSVENNFSEVMVTRKVVPPPPPRSDPPSIEPRELVVPPPITLPPSIPDLPRSNPDFGFISGGREPRMTWHLSVVNGGMPRGSRADNSTVKGVWRAVSDLNQPQWVSMTMDKGEWALPEGTLRGGQIAAESIVFGIPGGIPISGDFNGDGISQVGVYYQGQWFLDVNGNGRWDAEDLWARLGTIEDFPIVGDWDGDGKDDIGIFGPQWHGDPRAIQAEPGLPSPQNQSPRTVTEADSIPKNLPPEARDATDGHRVLKHTASGNPRIDVIDHVFRFGFGGDVPVAGDWNGDGIHSIGVFRRGTWNLDVDGDGRYTDQDVIATFGQPGDLPVVGDFNGDGIDQIGIYRKGTWILDSNGNRRIDAHDEVFRLGDAESKPVVGDWNGDGTDEPALYRDAG